MERNCWWTRRDEQLFFLSFSSRVGASRDLFFRDSICSVRSIQQSAPRQQRDRQRKKRNAMHSKAFSQFLTHLSAVAYIRRPCWVDTDTNKKRTKEQTKEGRKEKGGQDVRRCRILVMCRCGDLTSFPRLYGSDAITSRSVMSRASKEGNTGEHHVSLSLLSAPTHTRAFVHIPRMAERTREEKNRWLRSRFFPKSTVQKRKMESLFSFFFK
jgi:hypothetical protein